MGGTQSVFLLRESFEPKLVESVRQGRKEEFAAFHSMVREVPDPQSDKTFEQAKLQWNLLEEEPHRILLRYYQTLIALRQQLPALYHLDRQQLAVFPDKERETLIVHRWHEDQQVLCLMNFPNNHNPYTFLLSEMRIRLAEISRPRPTRNGSCQTNRSLVRRLNP